ncbi:secretion-regulating guanine nucleotide exchange factor [Anopheles bellator]|uniref:secretion-regulating guanine nucleotide exchange factor n=1 Tax=Anopheles bellator TaxID=139047 RepID=UPI00264A08AF|nr:secretion-regulating guanine nucleotide exchange factor [Anopheles bellator]
MFAWGANSHAQLGLGYATEQCDKPQPVTCLPFRNGAELRSIAAGGGHTLLSTADGRLYGCGWNSHGQLGLGHTDDVLLFEPIGEYRFESISAGWDVSGGINAQGELYVWGSNVWGQIDVPTNRIITKPKKLVLPCHSRALKVVFGLHFTAVLMESGKVWFLGKCKDITRHYPPDATQSIFPVCCIGDRGKVTDIAGGECHLVLLSEGNRITCLGSNKHGQCTYNETTIDDPLRLEAGWSHSGYLTRNGEVLLWGRNNYGQLGRNGDSSSVPVRLDIDGGTAVQDFSLGSQHGAALTACGRVYCWGWNEHANCGTAGEENVTTPRLVELPVPVSKVICGAGYTLAFI